MATSTPKPIRLGVSACLLGDHVRYDGGHKRDAFLTDLLDPFDLHKINTNYGFNTGLAPDCIRDEKGAKGYGVIRQKRQQQIQAAQAAQQAEMLGKAGAGLGRSPEFLQDQAKEVLTQKKQAA